MLEADFKEVVPESQLATFSPICDPRLNGAAVKHMHLCSIQIYGTDSRARSAVLGLSSASLQTRDPLRSDTYHQACG